jgi:hypothetical protein
MPGGNFLDADKINFFVLPKRGFDAKYKIQIGDVGVVINGRQVAYACYADRGPSDKLGEGSIALHRTWAMSPLSADAWSTWGLALG